MKPKSFSRRERTPPKSSSKTPFPQRDFEKVTQLARQEKFQIAVDNALILLEKYPQWGDMWNVLGAIYCQLRQFPEAQAAMQKALEIAPQNHVYLMNMGNSLFMDEQYEPAIAYYQQCLLYGPGNDVTAIYNLGTCYLKIARFGEAVGQYRQALQIDPHNTDSLYGMAMILKERKRLQEAEQYLRQCLHCDAKFVNALNGLAEILMHQKRLKEARQVVQYALTLESDLNSYLILAAIYNESGHPREAFQILGKFMQPDTADIPDAYVMLKKICERPEDDFEAQYARYQLCKEVVPNNPRLESYVGLFLLKNARYFDGWLHYKSLISFHASRRKFQGEIAHLGFSDPIAEFPDDLTGKHLLLHGEQGIGDELFFLRFVPQLKARGARITASVGKKICSLVARHPAIDAAIHELPAENTDIDYATLLGELPRLVKMRNDDDIPTPFALNYLPECYEAMKSKLSELGAPPYIGITWRAGRDKTKDKRGFVSENLYKEVDIPAFAKSLTGLRGTFISVQRNPLSGEREDFMAHLGQEVHDFSPLNDDLENMLALLALLNEYVGVSNTNMHLMSGIAGKARVLMPEPADWRWMQSGEQSPWFPHFKIYRQEKGFWSTPLKQLREDLIQSIGLSN